MNHFVCIHGHFYQPPRENPWLEVIEVQDSAHPWHDWNERICRECYLPNAEARILGENDLVEDVVSNYARMSFNFGPTLLSWLEERAPAVYAAILGADRESARRFQGHGSAIAQAYNHMILPLANRRDRITQILWGLEDFRRRFGRDPEGFWLPETAADRETLALLAEHGIRYTILAPGQARRVRPHGGGSWKSVDGGTIDPKRAYRAALRGGKDLALFFYDGPVSRAIAFEGLLSDGAKLADRLMGVFTGDGGAPQLAHVATDGETFGHHHRHGEMALAFALRELERREDVALTNYGAFLEAHAPEQEAEIHEPSSWSCAHGVDRWKRDCGCRSDSREGWTQAWREPLRRALDALRDGIAGPFEEAAGGGLRDPWAARDDYVGVILDRSADSVEAFFERHAVRELDAAQRVEVLRLLEMQRNAMLMYTSCGWFFDDLAGIETIQVLRYAGRVVQLARDALGLDLEEIVLDHLAPAHSNDPVEGSGRDVWDHHVRSACVDPLRVAGHYALASLFEDGGGREDRGGSEDRVDPVAVFCYEVFREWQEVRTAGEARLSLGRAVVRSRVTGESRRIEYVALHGGLHHVTGAVREMGSARAHGDDASGAAKDGAGPAAGGEAQDAASGIERASPELAAAFQQGDWLQVQRAIDRHFGAATCSLRAIFPDTRRRILDRILAATLDEIEEDHRRIYDRHAALMRFLSGLSIPQPKTLRAAASLAMTCRIRKAMERGREEDLEAIRGLLEECQEGSVELDRETIVHAAEDLLVRHAAQLAGNPRDPEAVHRLAAVVALVCQLPFPVDLAAAQTVVFRLLPGCGARLRELGEELGLAAE